MAKIEVSEPTGPLSDSDCAKTKLAVNELPGVADCQINANVLPNVVTVSYRTNGTPLRDIIKTI